LAGHIDIDIFEKLKYLLKKYKYEIFKYPASILVRLEKYIQVGSYTFSYGSLAFLLQESCHAMPFILARYQRRSLPDWEWPYGKI